MTAPKLVGRTLAGRYDVLAQLGAGGMGEVYRARDRELDELVALKVIRSDLAEAGALERFRTEIKLARRVTHANVARMFELGWADGLMFCTMELVDGESLAALLARTPRLPVAQAVAIACALCDALAAAHAAEVIHRDIKPANVMLAGDDGRVVLADFGIAAAVAGGDADTAGTPAYMAPEQARGEPPTPAADVYAVGVLLYEMLTGARAFPGPLAKVAVDKQEVARLAIDAEHVPTELASVVARATERRPHDRTPSALALRHALTPWAPATCAAAFAAPAVRPLPDAPERTVIVIAPRGEHPRIHVAEALHEELLIALARGRGIRVLPRVERAPDERGIELRYVLHADTLELRAPPVSLHVPLAIAEIPRSLALAVRMIDGLFAPAEIRDEAYELVALARHTGYSKSTIDEPLAMLVRAHALAPDDPRINASIGTLLVRAIFFSADVDPSARPRSCRASAAAARARSR